MAQLLHAYIVTWELNQAANVGSILNIRYVDPAGTLAINSYNTYFNVDAFTPVCWVDGVCEEKPRRCHLNFFCCRIFRVLLQLLDGFGKLGLSRCLYQGGYARHQDYTCQHYLLHE